MSTKDFIDYGDFFGKLKMDSIDELVNNVESDIFKEVYAAAAAPAPTSPPMK